MFSLYQNSEKVIKTSITKKYVSGRKMQIRLMHHQKHSTLINKTATSSKKVEFMKAMPLVPLVITPNPTPFYRFLDAWMCNK